MSEYDYDLFVIGAGSGGVRCARMSATMGAKVAIAEERYFGGTCVNVGCVPKKLYVYGSHFAEELELARSYGWSIDTPEFNWGVMRDNKVVEIQRLQDIYQRLLNHSGVEIFAGRAEIASPNQIRVLGKTVTAKRILIATGGWPYMPKVPGIEHAITSNEFFDLPTLPKKAVVVGGGYIAIEFACILHNLGVEVTLSYRKSLFLRGFDHDVRTHLRDELIKKGITLLFDHNVSGIEKLADGSLAVDDDSGSRLVCDLVIYATGRKPKVGGLGLENTSVNLSESGAIIVDDHFYTSEPSILAIGDVIDRVQLTPVALAEGMHVANELFGDGGGNIRYDVIPTAVFTQPPIGTVGLTEEQARERGHEVVIYKSEFAPMKYSFSKKKERALMKLIVDKPSDRVLGAHMVGADAGEIIQGIGIALAMGATKAQFDQTIGIHPTSAEEFVTMRTPVNN